MWKWAYAYDIVHARLGRLGHTVAEQRESVQAVVRGTSKDSKHSFTGGDAPLAAVHPLAWWEDLLCCLVMFLIPGTVLWMPLLGIVLVSALPWTGFQYLGWFCALIVVAWAYPSGWNKPVIHSRMYQMLLKCVHHGRLCGC